MLWRHKSLYIIQNKNKTAKSYLITMLSGSSISYFASKFFHIQPKPMQVNTLLLVAYHVP